MQDPHGARSEHAVLAEALDALASDPSITSFSDAFSALGAHVAAQSDDAELAAAFTRAQEAILERKRRFIRQRREALHERAARPVPAPAPAESADDESVPVGLRDIARGYWGLGRR